jgi:energy-coupling factor transporter transmembrane protein EcfT
MSSALMLYYQIYRWELEELLTILVVVPLQIIIYFMYYLALVLSVLFIVYTLLFRGYRLDWRRNSIPCWIGLLTYGIIIFVPFN